MNTKTNKVGRPQAEIKYPRGIFTINDLYELNRGEHGRGKKAKICKLTVRKHVDAQLKVGFLTEMDPVKSGKPGQPAAQFIRTAVKAGLEAARAARENGGGNTPVETPIPVNVEVSMDETNTVPVDIETAQPSA